MWHGESGLRRIRLSLQQWSSAWHTAWADVAPQGTAGSVRGPPRLRTKRCQRPARGGQGGHSRPWSARGSPHAPLPRPHTTDDAPAPNVNTPRSRSSGLLGSHSPREIPTPRSTLCPRALASAGAPQPRRSVSLVNMFPKKIFL